MRGKEFCSISATCMKAFMKFVVLQRLLTSVEKSM